MATPRTKLICTIGPASAGRVRGLVAAGMSIARINFAHGGDADHEAAAVAVRRAAADSDRTVGLLVDLAGPKIRLGELEGGTVELEPGARFVLRAGGGPGDGEGATTTYSRLSADVQVGDPILLADGSAELRVVERGDDVITEVVRGGPVRSRAGVNLPSARLSAPAVTKKDRRDVPRAVGLGADFLAQSFVRRAEDVDSLRRALGSADVAIVAKIETRAAIEDLERILRAADAIMVARGDLGVEIPFEEVPIVQKELIRQSLAAGVPVIVATQMLESMTDHARPTRAEASDVANAVFDGADAILLSAETAIGAYPVEAAEAAVRICRAAEERGAPRLAAGRSAADGDAPLITLAAAAASGDRGRAAAIACFSESGETPARLAALRPGVPVYAFSPDDAVLRQLALRHGVVPLHCDPPDDHDRLVPMLDGELRSKGLVAEATALALVASLPVLGPATPPEPNDGQDGDSRAD